MSDSLTMKEIYDVFEPTSFTLQYSKQQDYEHNCGQHCVSMITKIPVDVLSEEIKQYKGTHHHHVSWLLRRFGYDCDVVPQKYTPLMLLPELCILDVTAPQGRRRGGHWMVYFRGEIWDSCLGIHELTHSFLREYRIRIKSFLKVEI